jgi:Leucine-rich repeat (LRR) protein
MRILVCLILNMPPVKPSTANQYTFRRVQGFSGLKALHLECNAISVIENLQHMTGLRSLHIAKNMINDMNGLESLPRLQHLDISSNYVCSLEPIAYLTELLSLNASHNKVKDKAEIASLRFCAKLETLDLASNGIQDREALQLLMKLPVLLLRLVGNPIVSQTPCEFVCPHNTQLDRAPCIGPDGTSGRATGPHVPTLHLFLILP